MPYEQVNQALLREQEKRRMLQKEMLKSSAYNPYQQVSGRSVPYSPIQGLSQIAKAMIQRSALDKSDERTEALTAQQEEERARASQDVIEQFKGLEGGMPTYRDGSEAAGPSAPSVAADPEGAYIASASNEYTKGLTPVLETLMSREEADPYTLSQGQTRFGADNQPVASVDARPDKPKDMRVRPVSLPNGQWQDYSFDASGQPVETVGAPYSKAATASEQPSKYLEEREKLQAAEIADLTKSAEAAYQSNNALDRMITASEAGAQGGAQPLITGVKNMLSSVGVDSESLVNETVMRQSVAQMKVELISKFGARGLTDADMKIIADALPRVATSHDSRLAIAKILKKINTGTISDFSEALTFEAENRPGVKARTPFYVEEYRSSSTPPPSGFTVDQ